MLNITSKTKRAELVTEIERHRTNERLHAETRTMLESELRKAEERAANAERKAEILGTDVDNLLGAIRIMADRSRVVRIRRSSVQSADMAFALPADNTSEL